jgi:hypothetical protein
MVGMARDRLVEQGGYRNSIDTRMRAAAHLLQAALADLGQVSVPDVASELARRELVLLCRALASLVTDLTARLASLDAIALLQTYACPHCGWSRPCLKDGSCPRCHGLREVERDRQDRRVFAMAERRGRRRTR